MASIIPVEAFDYVVFGGTGDLALRKLLPALYHRSIDAQIPEDARIVGVSRETLSVDAYRERVGTALREFVPTESYDRDKAEAFLQQVTFCSLDATNGDWSGLTALLAPRAGLIRVFYMATSPRLYGVVAQRIQAHGLITPFTRIVLEKPIGTDLASAREVNDAVGAVFDEAAIYRIDHYLGKETVQNLMALRFANTLFEPQWSSRAVDHVQITVAETVGVEGRSAYYDHAGALRDMAQNHLLQLLCLTAMESPSHFGADSIREEKLKVLRALRPIAGEDVARKTVRGQYRRGAIHDRAVPGYLSEAGIAEDSETETFCAMKLEIDNWRWAGVPFYLRTGKRLAVRASEIVIAFRAVPHSIFEPSAGRLQPNKLIIRLQPDEGISLVQMIKEPGPGGMRLKPAHLHLSFAETFGGRHPEAYERLLTDVVRGNQTLFMHRLEVEAAWAWVAPILEGWAASQRPPDSYIAGSMGPTTAVALIERDGRSWDDELL